MIHDLPLLKTVAVGFSAAWVLGMGTQKLGLSPIVGYLLAGVLISPHTPGFVGDQASATQLAEIGVILLMFGVGLHFHVKDLMAVRRIAIPGAIGQSLVATLGGVGIFWLLGWSWEQGLIAGIAMSVASTVVLVRVLTDAGKLESSAGHAAVGWLIVEDIITVVALVLVPVLATSIGATPPAPEAAAVAAESGGHALAGVQASADLPAQAAPGASEHSGPGMHWALTLLIALGKLALMVVVVAVGGSLVVPRVLVWTAKLRSRELFTLSVLVMSVAVAIGAAYLFGASVALGAFLAGMVVAQSPVSHQAGADVLPLRDAFAVLFFVSVGMLFDPRFVVEQPALLVAGLAIVLVIKPLAAVVIVAALGFPLRTGLTVALGLAQIGEFSFIVGELGFSLGLLPEEGRSLLVACAIVSITINPLLFRALDRIEGALRRRPMLSRLLDGRARAVAEALDAEVPNPAPDDRSGDASTAQTSPSGDPSPDNPPAPPPQTAVVVGFGPAGREVDRLLRESGLRTCIVEMNIETVRSIRQQGRRAIFGDATNPDILSQAGLARASHLVLTMPEAASRVDVIQAAMDMNPSIRVLTRARYASTAASLASLTRARVAVDEIEAAAELARLVLVDLGKTDDEVRGQLSLVRTALAPPPPPASH